jgi:hypothetical protein
MLPGKMDDTGSSHLGRQLTEVPLTWEGSLKRFLLPRKPADRGSSHLGRRLAAGKTADGGSFYLGRRLTEVLAGRILPSSSRTGVS